MMRKFLTLRKRVLAMLFAQNNASAVDTTPGGAASALLLEDGFGFLLEDGSYFLLEG